MPSRIEVDAEVLPAGLCVRLRRADGEDGLLAGVEIIDIEVDVQLLRMIIARPRRWLMIRGQLERNRRSVWADELHPVVLVVGFAPELPARHGGVELGKFQRSRAIEGDDAESSDAGHGSKVPGDHRAVHETFARRFDRRPSASHDAPHLVTGPSTRLGPLPPVRAMCTGTPCHGRLVRHIHADRTRPTPMERRRSVVSFGALLVATPGVAVVNLVDLAAGGAGVCGSGAARQVLAQCGGNGWRWVDPPDEVPWSQDHFGREPLVVLAMPVSVGKPASTQPWMPSGYLRTFV